MNIKDQEPPPDMGDATAPPPDLPDYDEFWQARDELNYTRTRAQAKLTAPWAVLGACLARVVAEVPPWITLPAIIGDNAGSLNLYVGLVGQPGQGKGAATGVARKIVPSRTLYEEPGEPVVRYFKEKNVGSGEGIAKLFGRVKERNGPGYIERIAESVLYDIAEVDSLNAVATRSASTTLSEMRKGWCGEGLGFSNSDENKTIPIEPHTYRLCAVIGIQPGKAQVLLDDVDGGTPQRLLWLPVIDPLAPDERPKLTSKWTWEVPEKLLDGSPHEMLVCKTAKNAIEAHRLEELRGKGDASWTHYDQSRLKAAAALALYNGRTNVKDTDWELSAIVMEVSNRTRAMVEAHTRAADHALVVQRGHADAIRARIVDALRTAGTRTRADMRERRGTDSEGLTEPSQPGRH